MCKTLIEIMRPEIDAEVSKAVDEAVSKNTEKTTYDNTLSYLRSLMETLSLTAEQAMKALQIPDEQKSKYLAAL